MFRLLSRAAGQLRLKRTSNAIQRHRPSDAMWRDVLRRYPFLPAHPRLRELSALVLSRVQFAVIEPLELTDEMALTIAAQAAVLLLGMSLRDEAAEVNSRYDCMRNFDALNEIVVYPGSMRVVRSSTDEAGVVHHWRETLQGEAMEGGPIALSWQDVTNPTEFDSAYNLVMHEFAHLLDMRHGTANGMPELSRDFWVQGMLHRSLASARAHWQTTMQASFSAFIERLSMAERFGGLAPCLDAYAATAPEEFFAVASEAYFVKPVAFASEFRDLATLFDGYYAANLWRNSADAKSCDVSNSGKPMMPL